MPTEYSDAFLRRFWAKVDFDGPIPEHRPELGQCWVWTASRVERGYGSISVGPRRRGAHRVSWEIAYGVIPPELEVCHACDEPGCIRPGHLFLATHQENMRDAHAKGRLGGFMTEAYALPRGTGHHKARLSEEDVRVIRRRYAAGAPLRALAEVFGVSKSTIYGVVTDHNWRSVRS